jgi:hypothetical protein
MTHTEGDRAGGHWSKDYVEHLRTVHFTLIAVCLGLFVLATSPSPTGLSTAHTQIVDIIEFARTLQPNWFYKEAARQLESRERRSDASPEKFVPDPPVANAVEWLENQVPHRLAVEFPSSNWVVCGGLQKLAVDDSMSSAILPANTFEMKDNMSLDQFSRIWDVLNAPTEIRIPIATESVLYRGGFPISGNVSVQDVREKLTFRYIKVDSPTEKTGLSLICLEPSVSQKSPDYHNTGYLAWNPTINNGDFIVIPVRAYQIVPFDPQAFWVARFSPRWHHGSFEYTFRELNNITKNYQRQDLRTIEQIIADEEKRSGESFEAFGIKFPAEGTTRWGILVILAIQAYFWIHLRELGEKLGPGDPGWDVAWIGAYQSILARLLFRLTAFVLPVGVVLELGIRGLRLSHYSMLYWVVCVVGVLASGAVSFLAWQRVLRPEKAS